MTNRKVLVAALAVFSFAMLSPSNSEAGGFLKRLLGKRSGCCATSTCPAPECSAEPACGSAHAIPATSDTCETSHHIAAVNCASCNSNHLGNHTNCCAQLKKDCACCNIRHYNDPELRRLCKQVAELRYQVCKIPTGKCRTMVPCFCDSTKFPCGDPTSANYQRCMYEYQHACYNCQMCNYYCPPGSTHPYCVNCPQMAK